MPVAHSRYSKEEIWVKQERKSLGFQQPSAQCITMYGLGFLGDNPACETGWDWVECIFQKDKKTKLYIRWAVSSIGRATDS